MSLALTPLETTERASVCVSAQAQAQLAPPPLKPSSTFMLPAERSWDELDAHQELAMHLPSCSKRRWDELEAQKLMDMDTMEFSCPRTTHPTPHTHCKDHRLMNMDTTEFSCPRTTHHTH